MTTTIEERVRLRMRGGPPWGFRVDGDKSGLVYISSLRHRSDGKEQQMQLGDEVVSINGRSVQGLSGNVSMSMIENSVGVLELEIMRKRIENGSAVDYTSSAYSKPKYQQPQPQPVYQPQVYQSQPPQTHAQPYHSQSTYSPKQSYQQPAVSYQNTSPYQSSAPSPSQPSYHQTKPHDTPYHESHNTFQPMPTMNGGHVVQYQPTTLQVSPNDANDKQDGGGLTIRKKTTTTTRVLTKSGADKSERTITKTTTERVGNQEITTTTQEVQTGDEKGPKTVVKEMRYLDRPVEDLMEVAPASQGTRDMTGSSHNQTGMKKILPWETQRTKKRPVPPPAVKPKPKQSNVDMDRFQPMKYSPTGSPARINSPSDRNYNAKPRGWASPTSSIDNTPTSPRSVESGNVNDFRAQPLLHDQPRKNSGGFTDFNAKPRGFHPSSFTPRTGLVE